MAQTYLRNPSIERLPNILEELHTGALCIPPFQRDFEWTGDQRLALCNSVGLGLPTGSVMVWRTVRQLAAENPIGPYGAPGKRPAAGVQYLLDGRQRLTTLYAALGGAFWSREGKRIPDFDAENDASPDGSPWDIYYDLEHQDFVFAEDQENASQDAQPKLLPLSVLFDDSGYDDWRSNQQLSREHANRARAVRSAFMDYQIPMVPLAVEDIGIVTLTFKRVNNGGTPMSDADMARALAWSEGFDLRVHINNVRERLRPIGWGTLDDDPLLKVVAAVCGIEPIEVDPEALAGEIKERPEVVYRAGDHVLSAAQLLAERVGIVGPASLPYAQVLVFAARAFLDSRGKLNQAQQRELEAWVAEVCLDERFGGAASHVIRAEWRTFARRLKLPKAEPAVSKRDDRKTHVKECWKFGLGWARSLGTGLVLAEQHPLMSDGTPLPSPHSLVAKGSEDVPMLLAPGGDGLSEKVRREIKNVRGIGLRSAANRVVCPQAQLPALRKVLLSHDCPETILSSHLINEAAHQSLVAGNVEKFLDFRREDIWSAEQSWLKQHGGKVASFQRAPRKYSQG